MKLEKVILENYRGYTKKIEIPISNITTLIGKNDAGKSTILEALDTFFNESKAKFSIQDRNIHCSKSDVTTIGCVFSQFPEEVIIDETISTSLEKEYLLNENGLLEIHKEFNDKGKSSVYIIANHPKNSGFSELISKKNTELKTLIRQYSLEEKCNMTINSSMRKALWEYLGDELYVEKKKISASKEDGKKLWEKLVQYLPKYALFKSDRSSTDEDSEAQDPIQLAVTQAIEKQAEQLNIIKEQVIREVEQVANNTIEKLKEFDVGLASTLSPKYKKEPSWEKAFSFSLTGDEDIPINKRGSGVRRLVLFSFFRANVENEYDNNLIYAVEEPETSQHPNFQKIIVDTFMQMISNDKCQIILTTHVPGLAGLLPVNSLRLIKEYEGFKIVKQATVNEVELLKEISETLGVLPTINSDGCSSNVKAIICVEGPNDVSFLKNLSHLLHQEDETILDLEINDEIIIIPLGGGTLQQWTNFNYLKNLGIKEYHIYDRDGDAHYQQYCDSVNARGDGSSARLTRKRETENYIHKNAIKAEFNVELEIQDMMDIPKVLSDILKSRGERKCSESKVKIRLNEQAVLHMTRELLAESDSDGEIIGWLNEIKQLLMTE